MAKQYNCSDCPFDELRLDRSLVAKLGHIWRELRTNNRLSDKSIERLKKIFVAQSKLNPLNAPNEPYFKSIIDSITEHRNLDGLDGQQKDWVEIFVDMAKYKVFDMDYENF